MEEKQLIQCPDCGASISGKAPQCPRCGRPMIQAEKRIPWAYKLFLGGIVFLLVLFAIIRIRNWWVAF